ncbi:hemerythrin domain-containing protein [Marinicella litoralis]|uniref:Hemerythrin HHE cation binding domain-containing protein n=1 Tax=Marinicella litoralis TaxID=644220 RepID=A0A4R6XR93_9GAMM|nr:hemerythrin domain-containing protein [Marinicella litoralis]TDR20760.1 hemerythrin HHE cation binding domain-containing protein [Marinicella litoralis]
MKIFKSIEQDHHIQRQLVDQLLATSGESDERKQIFADLKKELSAHADAEERYFYVPLIKLDSTQESARHAIAEHHEIDELVKQLEQTEYSSPTWLKYAKDLGHKVNHHLAEEEQDYFPVAQKILSDDRAQQLGDEYLSAMLQARTG